MPIDFSTYAPATVLRVRCRDECLGHVHPHAYRAGNLHLMVRDGGGTFWINSEGSIWDMSDNEEDVTAIIGEMVLVQREGA